MTTAEYAVGTLAACSAVAAPPRNEVKGNGL